MPAGVKPYKKPKPKGRAAASVPRAPAPAAAKPGRPVAALPAFRPGGQRGGPAAGALGPTLPAYTSPPPTWIPPFVGQVGQALGQFATTPMYTPFDVSNVRGMGAGRGGAIPGWAAAAQIPRYGFSPSQFRSLEEQYRQPVRQGTMTKARAPVTARPYVQLEPPSEEGAYTPTEQGFAPYLPEMPYGGETPPYPDYGGGGGGGGYPPSAPREVPPWYYGLVSWRF